MALGYSASRTHTKTDKEGRVKVNPDLTIPNYPDIYVIGDLASALDHQGKTLAGISPIAMQGGAYAAKAILRKVKGQREIPPFHYWLAGGHPQRRGFTLPSYCSIRYNLSGVLTAPDRRR